MCVCVCVCVCVCKGSFRVSGVSLPIGSAPVPWDDAPTLNHATTSQILRENSRLVSRFQAASRLRHFEREKRGENEANL